MLRKIKFGIVGLGHIGIRHALCINQHTQGQLIGGYDILDKDKWRVKDLKVKYNSISQLMNLESVPNNMMYKLNLWSYF